MSKMHYILVTNFKNRQALGAILPKPFNP